MWFDTAGLSKGQVFVNGHNLGRYFTATAEGKPVGPQRRLYLPDSWLKPQEPNELLVFDEHGNAPHRTQIVFADDA
jgi:beta-galactosidase